MSLSHIEITSQRIEEVRKEINRHQKIITALLIELNELHERLKKDVL